RSWRERDHDAQRRSRVCHDHDDRAARGRAHRLPRPRGEKLRRSAAVTETDVARADSERGASTVLAVAIIATMLSVLIALVPLYLSLIERNRLAGAADAAALAAADVAIGREPGVPCVK